uniref:Retrovirus-related Pol polyprotein from transposon TNT 1-94 n=1 Tax=Tanacetum cinerariifolium TaxID=118510 RepID=A0A6L2M956_TANCI|nr:retrovirus-related Pol polyprotein from transposon TNT 1-94 [Tanacetum cinerariifolium]
MIMSFIRMVENQNNVKVKQVRTDNGTEFRNHELESFCDEKGISQNFSSPYTLEQNGIAKRKNKTFIEAARTMLNRSVLSKHFWTSAVRIAYYTQNRPVIIKRRDKTPYEIFRETILDISYFHVFGCPVFIHNYKDHLGKFDAKADDGYFLGYSFVLKSFRVFNTRRHSSVKTPVVPPNNLGPDLASKPVNETSYRGMIGSLMMVENQNNVKVKQVRTDNGTEFRNHELESFCDEKGISQNFSSPYTLEQNGIAKRKNKTFIEAARTMLNRSVLSKHFWTSAVRIAYYTQNRPVIIKRRDKTPYEIFRETILDISYFHVFGCPVFIHNYKDHLGKFDAKADDGYFLGYSFVLKSFRVFNTRRHSSVKTPVVPPNNLGPDLASKPVNETSYRGMIGSLMYLTTIRPDIQFYIVLCVRYQSNLKESNLTAMKRILRVLYDEVDVIKIALGQVNAMIAEMKVMNDPFEHAEYLGCLRDRKRMLGWKIMGLNQRIKDTEGELRTIKDLINKVEFGTGGEDYHLGM